MGRPVWARRAAALVISLLLLGSPQPAVAAAGELGFSDVREDDWFYDAVEQVVARGLFLGTGDTTFTPEGEMTRGMFVTVLARYSGTDTTYVLTQSFTDVDAEIYYAGPVEWACRNELIQGTGAGRFGPEASISRQDAVTVLYRYADREEAAEAYPDGALAHFSDGDAVADYALAAMTWAVQGEIIRGADGWLNPENRITRAEAAQMFLNAESHGVDRESQTLFSLDREQVDHITLTNGAHGGSAALTGEHLAPIVEELNRYTYVEHRPADTGTDPDCSFRLTLGLAGGGQLEVRALSWGREIEIDGKIYVSQAGFVTPYARLWVPDNPLEYYVYAEDFDGMTVESGTTGQIAELTRGEMEEICGLFDRFVYTRVSPHDGGDGWSYKLTLTEPGIVLGEDGNAQQVTTELFFYGDTLSVGNRVYSPAEPDYFTAAFSQLF